MKLAITLIIVLFTNSFAFTQKNVFVTISPKFGANDFQIATNVVDLSGLDVNVDYFDYYLSDVHIIHDGGQDLDLSDTVYLIEPDNHVLYLGFLNVTNIEQINFGIGVPPNLNTINGADAIDIAAYPVGHPLYFQDPEMHWGWASGYMFMIIGGLADSNTDGFPDETFQLHNVGDENYFNVQIPIIQTATTSDQVDLFINCHVDRWIKNISLETVGIQHSSSGPNAVVMNNILAEIVFDQSATASIAEVQKNIGSVFFSNLNSTLTINWKNVIGAANYRFMDIAGKQISASKIDGINGNLTFENLPNGIYIFELFDSNSNKLNSVKVAK